MSASKGFDGEDIRWIAPDEVKRDPKVNRFYEDARARKMVREGFDERRARSAGYVVSERANGDLIWLDGQHRGAAAQMAGVGQVKVQMTVLTGLTEAEEANWVLTFAEGKKSTTPVDAHRLGVRAGRPADLILDDICKKHEVLANGANGEGKLGAVGVARKIAEKENGERLLDLTFGTLIAAYGNSSTSLEGPLVRGLAYFWEHNNGNVDKASLITKLSKRKGGAAGLLGSAKGQQDTDGQPIYKCVASQVIGTYNKAKRTGQLPTL